MKKQLNCFLMSALLCIFGNSLISFASEGEIVPVDFESSLISKMAEPCWDWHNLGHWMISEMPNGPEEWTDFRTDLNGLLSNATATAKDFYSLIINKMPTYTAQWNTFIEHVKLVSAGMGDECESLWTAATVVNANDILEGQEDVEQFESVLMDRMLVPTDQWKQLAKWLMIYMPQNTSEEWAVFRVKLTEKMDYFAKDAYSFYSFVINSIPLNSERWIEFKKTATQFYLTTQENSAASQNKRENSYYSYFNLNEECQKARKHLTQFVGGSVETIKSFYEKMIHYWGSGQNPPLDPENPPQPDAPENRPVPKYISDPSNHRGDLLQNTQQNTLNEASEDEIEIVVK